MKHGGWCIQETLDLKWYISTHMLHALVELLFLEMLSFPAQTGPLASFLCHACPHTHTHRRQRLTDMFSWTSVEVASSMWNISRAHFHCLHKFDLYANYFYDDKETKMMGRRGRTALPTPVNKHRHTHTHTQAHPFFMLITAFTIRQTVITLFMQRGDP